MAMFEHGFRRFTEGVDILVIRDGLKQTHDQLEGWGYVSLFTGRQNLRDTEDGVRIEFLIAGEYPGDGKPKLVAFSDPALASTEFGGIRYLVLAKLVELKIVSGITSPGRLKDLGDGQEIIRTFDLPIEFAEQLSPYVWEKYTELWTAVKESL